MRDPTDGPWRWPAVLPMLSCACLALGSCSDAERDAGASPSQDTSGTVPASAVQPILVSPESCPVGAEGGSVEPWSDVEVVEVDLGRPLHMRGCESEGEAFVEFSYVRPLPVAGLHLLEVALYEGGVWIVVNSVTGRRWTLSGAPRLSPDRRWLATTILDLEAGYQRNHLDVWAVEADSLRRGRPTFGSIRRRPG